MNIHIKTKTWRELIEYQRSLPYFQKIEQSLEQQYSAGKIIYPEQNNIFKAFDLTAYEDVKVVIIGQDPYHNEHQAHGLAFSVNKNVKIPPSLRNIFKELQEDVQIPIPTHGDLSSWAKQGVLLLNTTLTVEAHQAHSHASLGWVQFTDSVITALNQHQRSIIYLLWGSAAQKKATLISKQHQLLTSSHPSPLSAYRGFLGCQHFSKTNALLAQSNQAPIRWDI